ncbi:unnamed protein product [Dibothriocephalus latus]|uniref:Uncharacterized protein n=1 Tax=Dibothriocephalus latus TaxID=60516 RepID=A0A3P7MRB1_DIBLA|nr:unnamed protein product [Dibothriocephalus latus]
MNGWSNRNDAPDGKDSNHMINVIRKLFKLKKPVLLLTDYFQMLTGLLELSNISKELASKLMSPMITSDRKAAKSNQLATKLMSTIPPPAEVHKEKKEEEEPGEKAPAASKPHQTPGRSTRSGAQKRRGAPTNPPPSSPTFAADSLNLSTRESSAKKARTSASRRLSRKRMRTVPSQVNPQLESSIYLQRGVVRMA